MHFFNVVAGLLLAYHAGAHDSGEALGRPRPGFVALVVGRGIINIPHEKKRTGL